MIVLRRREAGRFFPEFLVREIVDGRYVVQGERDRVEKTRAPAENTGAFISSRRTARAFDQAVPLSPPATSKVSSIRLITSRSASVGPPARKKDFSMPRATCFERETMSSRSRFLAASSRTPQSS